MEVYVNILWKANEYIQKYKAPSTKCKVHLSTFQKTYKVQRALFEKYKFGVVRTFGTPCKNAPQNTDEIFDISKLSNKWAMDDGKAPV